MKYNIGDTVRIKSKNMFESFPKDKDGKFILGDDIHLSPVREKYFGQTAVIKKKYEILGFYALDIDGLHFAWTDEMFEDEEPEAPASILQDIAKAIREHNLDVTVKEEDGKLIIEPLKVEEDLPVDTPVMISYDKTDWWLRYYAGDGKAWRFGQKSNADYGATNWDYIIPFDKFDPNNIEESLKHNIVRNK